VAGLPPLLHGCLRLLELDMHVHLCLLLLCW
jgi:hypothetical protein